MQKDTKTLKEGITVDTTILKLFSDDQLKEEIFRRISSKKHRVANTK